MLATNQEEAYNAIASGRLNTACTRVGGTAAMAKGFRRPIVQKMEAAWD